MGRLSLVIVMMMIVMVMAAVSMMMVTIASMSIPVTIPSIPISPAVVSSMESKQPAFCYSKEWQEDDLNDWLLSIVSSTYIIAALPANKSSCFFNGKHKTDQFGCSGSIYLDQDNTWLFIRVVLKDKWMSISKYFLLVTWIHSKQISVDFKQSWS